MSVEPKVRVEMSEHEWRPRVNPWLIAAAVMLATFMEVLDTSIASVALPYIGGNLGATTVGSDLGADQLSGFQRHCAAGQRLAFAVFRAETVFDGLHRHLFRFLLFMRGRAQACRCSFSRACFKARAAARCNRWRSPSCWRVFRRPDAARPWRSMASAWSARPFWGRRWAAG